MVRQMGFRRIKLSLSEVAHVEVFKDGNMVLNIFVYDVVNDQWIFRLDNKIRLPKIIFIFTH